MKLLSKNTNTGLPHMALVWKKQYRGEVRKAASAAVRPTSTESRSSAKV